MSLYSAGVTYAAYQNGQCLEAQRDGYLGQLQKADVALRVTIAAGQTITAFTVDKEKNITPHTPTPTSLPSALTYELTIPVSWSQRSECWTTRYPANNLRLAEQLTADPAAHFNATGAVQIWEIAVISQAGRFFLTTQPTWYAECFRSHPQELTYPCFAKWPAMQEYLLSLLPPHVRPGPIESYQPPEDLPHEHLHGNEGIVSWYSDAQGLGCILLKGQPAASVHWQQIGPRGRRAYLHQGEHVRFLTLRTRQQTTRRSTTFAQEAAELAVL